MPHQAPDTAGTVTYPSYSVSNTVNRFMKLSNKLSINDSYGRDQLNYLWSLVDRVSICTIPKDIQDAHPDLYDLMVYLTMSMWMYDSTYDSAFEALRVEHLRLVENAFHVYPGPAPIPASFEEYVSAVNGNYLFGIPPAMLSQQDHDQTSPSNKLTRNNAVEGVTDNDEGQTQAVQSASCEQKSPSIPISFRAKRQGSSNPDAIDDAAVSKFMSDIEEILDVVYSQQFIQGCIKYAKATPTTWLYLNYWLTKLIRSASSLRPDTITSVDAFDDFRLDDSGAMVCVVLYALVLGIDVGTLSQDHLEVWMAASRHVGLRNDVFSFPRDIRDKTPNVVTTIARLENVSYYEAFQKSCDRMEHYYNAVMSSPLVDAPAKNIMLGLMEWEEHEPRYASGFQLLRACKAGDEETFDQLLKKYFAPSMTFKGDFNPLHRAVQQ